jgi:hypothetical protein
MAENCFQKRNSTEKTDKELPKLAPLVREISWSHNLAIIIANAER